MSCSVFQVASWVRSTVHPTKPHLTPHDALHVCGVAELGGNESTWGFRKPAADSDLLHFLAQGVLHEVDQRLEICLSLLCLPNPNNVHSDLLTTPSAVRALMFHRQLCCMHPTVYQLTGIPPIKISNLAGDRYHDLPCRQPMTLP